MIRNLYQILNIPYEIYSLSECNIVEILHNIKIDDTSDNNLQCANKVISIINKFHSYFHFEQSFLYTLKAFVHFVLNDEDNKKLMIKKALFQDPLNQVAIKLKHSNILDIKEILSYDKHIKYETDFLRFAFNNEKLLIPNEHQNQISALDRMIHQIYKLKYVPGTNVSYNSHRFDTSVAITAILKQDCENALSVMESAISNIEKNHLEYHKMASEFYKFRSSIFFHMGLEDLSKNDLIKSSDLFA